MMRYICFLACLLIYSNTTAQLYAAMFIPSELRKDANEVVRFEEKVFTARSLKEGTLQYKIIVTILNEKSTANRFSVYYDKESKVSKIKARLLDAMGMEVRKIDKDEIQDLSAVSDFSIYEDDRLKHLEINHSHYPYSIELEYEMSLKGIFFVNYPNWYIQAYNTAVEQGQFVVDLPDDLSFFYQAMNINIEPAITREGGRKRFTWSVQNLPALKKEDYSPPMGEIIPMILTAPEQFEWDRYSGSMRSWKDFGTFVHALYDGRDKLPAEAVSQIKNLTAKATSDREKIDILYRYMQQNMRYVSVQLGIGGWQPFDAEYVAERKYGDCKALTNYMKAMLKEVGIKAYPVLIRTGEMFYEVSDTFTSPSFNHVILNVPSEDYWLECTSATLPPNYIAAGNDNRNALMITEAGGKLVKTPVLSYRDNVEENHVQVTLSESGGAILENTATLKGAQHSYYRSMQYHLNLEDQKKYFLKNGNIPTANIDQFEILPSAEKPECTLLYNLDIPRYGSKAGRRFFVPVNVISAYSNVPEPVEKRCHPIVIDRGYTEQDTFVFTIPEAYAIESIPKETAQLSNEYARYEIKVEKTPQGFTMTRHLEVEAVRLPAAEYESFRNFFKEVAKQDKMQVVLVKKS